MNKQGLRLSAWYGKARFIYLIAYVIYTTLNKYIWFQFVPSYVGLVYSALAIAGGLLLAIDLFTNRDMLRTRYSGLLVLFLGVMAVSILVNARYGIGDNLKTFVWSCIQMLLLCAVPAGTGRETLLKQFRVVAEIFIAMWFAGVVVSFGQFLVQYGVVVSTPTDPNCPEGFLSGRLFGVFTDPNVAAVCSILAIAFAAFLLVFCKRAGKLRKSYYIVTIVFEAIYVILSGSRTAELIVLGVGFVGAFLYAREKLRNRNWKRVLRSLTAVGMAAVCAVTLYVGMSVSKDGLAHVPPIVQNILTQDGENEDLFPDDMPEDVVDMTRPDVEDNEDVSNARFKIWAECLKLVQASPIFGTSPRNHLAFAEDHFEDLYIVSRQYSVHNGYLAVLVCTGILGALVILAWICGVVKDVLCYLFCKHREDPCYVPAVFFSAGLLAVAVSAFLMMGIFFGNSIIEVLFWYLLGNVLYMLRLSEPEKYAKEPLLYRVSEAVRGRLTAGRPDTGKEEAQ